MQLPLGWRAALASTKDTDYKPGYSNLFEACNVTYPGAGAGGVL